MSLSKAKLILTVGLSGSGKSTWAAQFVAEDPVNRVEVNRDDIRLRLYGREDMYKGSESRVTEVQLSVVESVLREGKTVVVSDTNLVSGYRTPFYKLANKYGAELVLNDSFLSVPLHVCIERDSKREYPVGEDVIRKQHAKITKSNGLNSNNTERLNYSGYKKQDPNLPKCYIFDIDGTLTEGIHPDRKAFEWDKVGIDVPNEPVITVLHHLYQSGRNIILMSGRDSVCREQTEEWITKNTCLDKGEFSLFMRHQGDYRKDAIVKEELYNAHIKDKYFVCGIFDDRKQVVELYRDKLGLPCFQVAWGNF